MDLDILVGVNWEAPSKQNLIDLYLTRMDLISFATGFCAGREDDPSVYIVDDTRSAIMSYTRLSIEKYNALIEEAIHILNEDGIPELFLSETYWESWGVLFEPDDDDRQMAYDVLYDLYHRYLMESKEIDKRFFEIVKPGL